MKKIIYIVCAAFLLLSCSGITPRSTMKKFFNAIYEGEYMEALEQTTLGQDGDTELYCALMEKERKSIEEKGGIKKVEILSEEPSLEEENCVVVTALLTYGNLSTHEEVCQMIKVDGRWKIDVDLNAK